MTGQYRQREVPLAGGSRHCDAGVASLRASGAARSPARGSDQVEPCGCPYRPKSPEQIGYTTPEAARAAYLRYPHLRPCPFTKPPWQWLHVEWCKTRCWGRRGQEPEGRGRGGHPVR